MEASLVPLFKGVRAETKSNGLMTSDAELWNGRFAMLGLVGLAFTEFVQGSGKWKKSLQFWYMEEEPQDTAQGEDQRCIPWTPEEETALCKAWVRISEDSFVGNARKEKGFWVEVQKQLHAICLISKRRTGAGVTDYIQRAMPDYQVEYSARSHVRVLSRAIRVSSRVCKGKGAIAFWAGPNLVVWARYAFWARGHVATNCRSKKKEELRSDKWNSGEVPGFMQERDERMRKRYKSSGESSVNTSESGDNIFNLNNTAVEEEDEVQEVRQSCSIGRDQVKRKAKTGTSSADRLHRYDTCLMQRKTSDSSSRDGGDKREVPKFEEPSSHADINHIPSANQLDAKVMQLLMKGFASTPTVSYIVVY
ncbi:early light-inducible protein [Tanacetum coccineum]